MKYVTNIVQNLLLNGNKDYKQINCIDVRFEIIVALPVESLAS
jgi:hypothetical protein